MTNHQERNVSDLPRSIRIGAVEYTVDATPEGWAHSTILNGGNGHGFLGRTDIRTCSIYINPDQAPTNQRLTLLHEAMHAICASALGSPDWHGLGKGSDPRQETVIRTWEAPLLNLLRDNPELTTYLTAD